MDDEVSGAFFVDDEVVGIEVADLAGRSHAEHEPGEGDGLDQDVFVFVGAVFVGEELVDERGKRDFDVVFVDGDGWCLADKFPVEGFDAEGA